MSNRIRVQFEGVLGEYTYKDIDEAMAYANKHGLILATTRTVPKAPTKTQFAEKELELIRNYAPEVRTCGTCFWPVLKPYACTTCGETNS